MLAHAGFPLLHLSYADDGGELGRAGTLLDAAAPVALAAVVGIAWVTQPPLVRLAAGVHEGPLVLDHAQRLVGEPGAVVRGGIVITADDVTVRDVSVLGGETGIEVRDAERVLLEDVSIMGAELDGISARRSTVTIRDCFVHSLVDPRAQGIDISFGMMVGMSRVEGCTVIGGQEGIVTHMAMAALRGNHVSGTSMRGITMTEMSAGEVEGNEVLGRTGRRDLLRRLLPLRDRAEQRVRHPRATTAAGAPAAGTRSRRTTARAPRWTTTASKATRSGIGAFLNAEIRPG